MQKQMKLKKQIKILQIKECLNLDEFYKQIDTYLNTNEDKFYPDPLLLFWKCHESQFPNLEKLAKKYLAVPASSPAVE